MDQRDQKKQRIDQLFDDILKPHNQMTEKQRRILETSLEMFAEKGYNGVSTSEIAKKANVAEGTIFKHFKTKKGLFLNIVVPALARAATPAIKQTLKEIVNSEKPLNELLKALILDRVHLFDDNWPLVKVIVRESQYHPEIWQAINYYVANKVYKIIEEVVKSKQETGQLRRDIPAYVIVRTVISNVLGYVMLKHFIPDVMKREHEETEIGMVVDVLLNGITSNANGRP